jgi:hypothetical protein
LGGSDRALTKYTLAYYDTQLFTDVKSFGIHGPTFIFSFSVQKSKIIYNEDFPKKEAKALKQP